MNRSLLLALSIALITSTRAADERPNILFLFADDWGRYASSLAGVDGRTTPSEVVKTPNIDRIAKRGVLFKNAFVTAPSCTPCRSSLLSGQYFFRTGLGAMLQGAKWDPAIPTYPLLLKDAGYTLGKSYKVWSPGDPPDAPYGGQKFAFQKSGGEVNKFSGNATRSVAGGMSVEAAKDKLLANTRGNFESFLGAREKGKPFCFWYGPTNTHRIWEKGSGKALWGINPDDLKGKLPAFLPDVPEVREDFADYLGEAQAFDAQVGVILKLLEDAGELDHTIVMVSGDHGPPGFPHGKCNLYSFGTGVTLAAMGPGIKAGRVVDDFVNLMDLAPTFLEIGGVKVPEVMTGKSLLNVLKSDKSGLVDPSRTHVVTGRERHVAAAREGNLTYPQRALRNKDFLYIHNFKADRWPLGDPKQVTETTEPTADELENNTFVAFPDMDSSPTKAWLVAHRNEPGAKKYYDYAFGKRQEEELYDLAKDPDEINNIAADPAYAETRKKMADQLMKILIEAKDPRVVGDGLTFEKPPFTGALAPDQRDARAKNAKVKPSAK